jgi:hypothetical protein
VNKRSRAALAAILAASAVSVTACGVGPDKSREDAHDTVNVDKTAPHVTAFNNKYPNVEDKCDGAGHRIFVTSTKRVIVIPDPTCPGFIRGAEPSVVFVGQ